MRTSRRRRPSLWAVLVPVVALVAGLLFATSSRTALGTDLRAGASSQLSDLIQQRDSAVARQQDELALLQQQVQSLTDQAASRNTAVAEAQGEGELGLSSAGLTPVTGPGVTVTLDDAPAEDPLPTGARGDDLVIHQSDVQGVVNAMWAAGADGVAIMGKRLIATSAVICVGNTILLQGRLYSPPFQITAVGSPGRIRDELAASTEVQLLRRYVALYGLTYDVADEREVSLPAYNGRLEMQYATRAAAG